MRLAFRAGGLPEPVVNQVVRDAHGSPLHRPDLCWPQWRVAADYDGRHHFQRDSDEAVRAGRASNWRARQDLGRYEVLEQVGWRLRVFTAFDVFQIPESMVLRVREALIEAGAPL